MYISVMPLCKRFFSLCFTVLILTGSVIAQQTDSRQGEKRQGKRGKSQIHRSIYSCSSHCNPGKTDAEPPSDAIVLFDGKNLDLWRAEGPDSTKAAGWKVHDKIMTVDKKAKVS
jgi:hypothetical protein